VKPEGTEGTEGAEGDEERPTALANPERVELSNTTNIISEKMYICVIDQKPIS
jgi:hypothetical protein